jgi:Leucine-rich repeat (LRR) protein
MGLSPAIHCIEKLFFILHQLCNQAYKKEAGKRHWQFSFQESFGRLMRVTWLDLKRNQLKSLPDSFGDLLLLKHLDLTNNKLVFDKSLKLFCVFILFKGRSP